MSANAATDRESTVYWARVPRREAARAIDVLGELPECPAVGDLLSIENVGSYTTSLAPDFIIPSVFDRRVCEAVAARVEEAACETGVARRSRATHESEF